MITGIPTRENLDELRKVLKGGKVIGIKQLKVFRNGEKVDSEFVQFSENELPVKVMVGYVSFHVGAYVSPPLRCSKCQRYGHTVNVCRGKHRCDRRGG